MASRSSNPALSAVILFGVKDALMLPAWLVGFSMLGYGPLARDSGLGFWVTVTSSASVWGLPGQVAMAEMFALGAPLLAIVLTSSAANARFMPMTVSMIPLFKGHKPAERWNLILAQLVSVNTWVGLHRRAPELPLERRAPFYVAFSLTCMAAGMIGTGVGYQISAVLPPYIGVGLIFLNPIYFAFVFAGSKERMYVVSLIFGAALGPLAHLLTPNWGVLLAGFAGGALGFLFDGALRRREGSIE